MKLFVTGGTGFFGSHVVCALVRAGHEVVVVRRQCSSLSRLRGVSGSVRYVEGQDGAVRLLRGERFAAVVHAATCYGRDGDDPGEVVRVNVGWPLELVAAAVDSGTELFVNTDTTLPPSLSDYARTKREFSTRLREVGLRGRIRVLNVRLESVYGPRDDGRKLVTRLMRAMLSGETAFELTPGAQCRDFIYVDDAVAGYLRLLDHALSLPTGYLEAGVGRGEPVSIRQLAELLKRLTASPIDLHFGAMPYRQNELMVSAADTRTLDGLGWPGGRSLEEGLAETLRLERRADRARAADVQVEARGRAT
jgi:nucleoside-diphosphate-sugar epimerase